MISTRHLLVCLGGEYTHGLQELGLQIHVVLGEGMVDEVNDVSFVGTGRVVGGDDLRADSIDVFRLLRSKEFEFVGSALRDLFLYMRMRQSKIRKHGAH